MDETTKKAIQTGLLEEQLKEVDDEIRKVTHFMNNYSRTFSKSSKFNIKRLESLLVKKKYIEHKILKNSLVESK